MISNWLFCTQNQKFLPTCGACLEAVFVWNEEQLVLVVAGLLVPLGLPK